MFTKRHDGIIRRIPSKGGVPVPDAQGTHVQSAQGAPVPSARGVHGQSADRAPAQEAQGIRWQDLTFKQQQVLEWLAKWLKGDEREITCLYRKIGMALKIKQRAARVHIDALKGKGLILTTVAYRQNSKQKIGVRVSISPSAPIKHLPHKMSEAELLEMQEAARKNAQVMALIEKGYAYIPELNGYVREPQQNG